MIYLSSAFSGLLKRYISCDSVKMSCKVTKGIMERVLDEEKAKHGVRRHCGKEAVVGKRRGQSPHC